MMRLRIQLLTILLAALAVGCAASPAVFTDHDSSQDFASYKSFAWISDSPMVVSGDRGPSPLVSERLRAAIVGTLQKKGYRFVDAAGDAEFVVSFTVGARDRIEIREREVVDYYGPHWRWGYDYFGVAYPRGFPRTEVTSRQYTEGSLAIDVFDSERKSPVWHGSASKRLSRDQLRRESAEVIDEAVATILAGFPPQ